MAEKKTGFNLAEALAGVSKLDTGVDGREQIEYIDIDRIDDDPNNFYELSGLNELAANIELCGLQQPIRVRANPEDASRVIIVSGHRRRAAIRQLVNDGRDDLREIPCIRERTDGSAALQELRLIYANSDTRKLTSAEMSKQAERVEALLYQLKEEGYEFPGRMRDHVAEACKLSKTKLANLKVIRENLEPNTWKVAWERGKIVDSVALTVAKMPIQHQLKCWEAAKDKTRLEYYYESDAKRDGEALKAIEKLKCPDGGTCQHLDGKFEFCKKHPWGGCSGRCCGKCSELGSCQHACPKFYEKIKQIKADKKEQRKQEKLAKEEAERPTIQAIQRFWNRFGEARNAAGKTVKECYKALNMYYASSDEQKVIALECLEAKFSANTNLPYGYSCFLSDVTRYVQIADLLGVSLDYLLCRTDNPKGIESNSPAAGWVPLQFVNGMEEPPKSGKYYCRFDCDGAIIKQLAWWDGVLGTWSFKDGGAKIDAKCLGWFPLPEDDEI